MPHELPPLPYEYGALEPHIDEQTMRLHHDKHHAAYVANLNAALDKRPELREKPLEDLLSRLDAVPEEIRTAVRNNGGGHLNHSLFWELMRPGGAAGPGVELAEALRREFGGVEQFKEAFTREALGRFGSGWAWLLEDEAGRLRIESTPNQDHPIMARRGVNVLLGLDVWEHAYYLKYQNRRADYVSAWWNVVDWDAVARRHEASTVSASGR